MCVCSYHPVFVVGNGYKPVRYCYYGKTKKQAIAEFKRNFGNFRGFVKKEWEFKSN